MKKCDSQSSRPTKVVTNVTSHNLVSGCLKVSVTLELRHLQSVVSMAKLNTGSMAMSTFAHRTLNKCSDSPHPRHDTGLTADNSHWPPGRQERSVVPHFPFAQNAQQFPTHLKCGVRSIVSQCRQGCQSSSTAAATPSQSHSQSYSLASWWCRGCAGLPPPWSLGMRSNGRLTGAVRLLLPWEIYEKKLGSEQNTKVW